MHQIVCRLELRPRPRWGSLQRSPDPLAAFRGPTSKGRGRRIREKRWSLSFALGRKKKSRRLCRAKIDVSCHRRQLGITDLVVIYSRLTTLRQSVVQRTIICSRFAIHTAVTVSRRRKDTGRGRDVYIILVARTSATRCYVYTASSSTCFNHCSHYCTMRRPSCLRAHVSVKI